MRLNKWLALLLAALLCGALFMGALAEEADTFEAIEIGEDAEATLDDDARLELELDGAEPGPLDLAGTDEIALALDDQLVLESEGAPTEDNGDMEETTVAQRTAADAPEEFEIVDGVLVRYRGTGGKVTVPNGVTEIGENAFRGCETLTGITLPEGLTTIGERAFANCTALTEITLPKSLKTLAPQAFNNAGLTSVTIRGNFSIPEQGRSASGAFDASMFSFTYVDSPFVRCPLTSAVIEDGVTELPTYLFGQCRTLARVTLPKNLTTIPEGTFSGCEALTQIDLPAGVTEIGIGAFLGCKTLTGVVLPSGVTRIGDGAFYHCEALTGIDLPAGLTTIGKAAFMGAGLTDVTIPNIRTEVGECAFAECHAVKTVTLDPAYLWKAFCPQGATTLEFTRLTVLDGVTTVNEMGPCRAETIVLPDTVTTIGARAFMYNEALTSINLPDSVTSIGDTAFMNCTSLTRLAIPPKVTQLPVGTFVGCTGLQELVVNGDSPLLDLRYLNALTTVQINGSVKKVLIWDCPKLSGLTLSAAVKTVELNDVPALGKLTLPAAVKSLMLLGAKKLSSLKLPVGIKTVNLDSCAKLTKLEIPSTVTSLRLYNLKGLKGSLFIPRSVSSIGAHALAKCAKLQTVVIESGVKSIRDSAFAGCKALKAIVIPATVKGIGVDAIPANKGLVIYGAKKSFAKSYADMAKITFKTIGKAKKVSLNRTGTVTMKVKDKLQLIATLSPVGAQEKLTWSSSKKSVASVSAKGVVTAKKAGTAKITVKTASGMKATVTIKVS